MKRFLLIIVVLIILLTLSSCNNEFTFRGNRFGDSIEKVKQTEGDKGEITEGNSNNSLYYSNIELYEDFTGDLNYIFDNNELQYIIEMMYYYNKTIKDVYSSLKSKLEIYGNPNEESKEDKVYKALWEKDEYGIVLIVADTGIIITYSMDSNKSKKFYGSLQFIDLG